MVAKPLLIGRKSQRPTVSVVVPARNEAGNIENIINRIPAMSDNDEIIFVEGNSTDNTWQVIEQMYEKYRHKKILLLLNRKEK